MSSALAPIEHEELLTLIPHKGKMVLIDRITACDIAAWTVASETVIAESNLFFDKTLSGIPNFVLFEFIAQTISALTGIVTREKHLPVNNGFILSVSSLTFSCPLVKAHDCITVNAVRTAEAGDVYSFEATVSANGSTIGSAKLTVMEARAPSAQ